MGKHAKPAEEEPESNAICHCAPVQQQHCHCCTHCHCACGHYPTWGHWGYPHYWPTTYTVTGGNTVNYGGGSATTYTIL